MAGHEREDWQRPLQNADFWINAIKDCCQQTALTYGRNKKRNGPGGREDSD